MVDSEMPRWLEPNGSRGTVAGITSDPGGRGANLVIEIFAHVHVQTTYIIYIPTFTQTHTHTPHSHAFTHTHLH